MDLHASSSSSAVKASGTELDRYDFVVATAAEVGIRLILPLVSQCHVLAVHRTADRRCSCAKHADQQRSIWHWSRLSTTEIYTRKLLDHLLSMVQLNFWRDNGGIDYYVKATLGAGHDPEEFFRHDAPQAAFRHWVGRTCLQSIINMATLNRDIFVALEPACFRR
jgi:hypothetical protein